MPHGRLEAEAQPSRGIGSTSPFIVRRELWEEEGGLSGIVSLFWVQVH
jgi:hypothetical protein